ncbi:MAG TPA: GNAT family N-acetyltransferase [Anaerolineales bacterium]|nr:GNAT family N-acetyltransferase [Anaerolineae bacterium]HIP86973.1 GNAT family N-acetyltransferase [Anaerolineales bacterium]
MIRIEPFQTSSAFDRLAEEWDTLLCRSAMDTIFLTPTYQRTWWRHLGQGDLLLLTVREGEELTGVAPLFLTEQEGRRVLQTVGCVEVSDYLDWVLAPGREEEILAALLDFLNGSLTWDAIDLCNVHQDSPTLALLPAPARRRGWSVRTEVQEVCPVVDLPETWEAYLASLGRKDRHELRRKMRRAEAMEGLRWYIVGPEHDLGAEMEAFLHLMAASAPEKAAFLTAPMRAFFQELARATFEAGWLQLAFLEVEGRRLASYLNFVYDNRVLVYNSGLDWEAYPTLGAGIVLTGLLIRHAIEKGRETYDFLRGSEPYKYRLGGKDVTVHRILIEREG